MDFRNSHGEIIQDRGEILRMSEKSKIADTYNECHCTEQEIGSKKRSYNNNSIHGNGKTVRAGKYICDSVEACEHGHNVTSEMSVERNSDEMSTNSCQEQVKQRDQMEKTSNEVINGTVSDNFEACKAQRAFEKGNNRSKSPCPQIQVDHSDNGLLSTSLKSSYAKLPSRESSDSTINSMASPDSKVKGVPQTNAQRLTGDRVSPYHAKSNIKLSPNRDFNSHNVSPCHSSNRRRTPPVTNGELLNKILPPGEFEESFHYRPSSVHSTNGCSRSESKHRTSSWLADVESLSGSTTGILQVRANFLLITLLAL